MTLRRALALGWLLSCLAGSVSLGASSVPARGASSSVPVLAYYYIWFDVKSWDRAKTDFPILGRYSSDDQEIMREHVRMAQQAGIDGFIVSWKSTEKLNRRLEQLIEVANAEDFKLAIIYQGLDFYRKPLPVTRIKADVAYFVERYADNQAFTLFGAPLMIWSGTWEFSADDVASVAAPYADRLLLLASEKNVAGYQRLAAFVDGNAYYWSSVNPETFPGYQEKLDAMAEAIHADGGYWIAPAAPGFDAREIGGTRTVERQDGATLRRQMEAAIRSSPDAVGLISWNEFSENSHIEPSVDHGTRYLEVLAEIRDAQAGPGSVLRLSDVDSSAPGSTAFEPYNLAILGMLVALVVASMAVIVRRNRHNDQEIRKSDLVS
ncbi:MAG TPA: endo-1,3-alpha-glucanase family glycosylhydrolase [Herpetosiphonaceae bacterium]